MITVHKVADWGYKYIEQSPHPRINPFYKHPLFSKEVPAWSTSQALKETGVEISSFIVVYRWSGPTEEQRQHAVANWKRMIEIAVDMGVPVINTEFSGDPNQQEICNGMFFKSDGGAAPDHRARGHPRRAASPTRMTSVELNDEACDIVKSFRSKNLGYVYSASHGFFYDQGKGDVRHMLKYAGDELTHVLSGRHLEPDQGLPLHRQSALAEPARPRRLHHPSAHRHGRGRGRFRRHLRDPA